MELQEETNNKKKLRKGTVGRSNRGTRDEDEIRTKSSTLAISVIRSW